MCICIYIYIYISNNIYIYIYINHTAELLQALRQGMRQVRGAGREGRETGSGTPAAGVTIPREAWRGHDDYEIVDAR